MTGSCQYIEFSFDAVELGRYACPDGILDASNLGGVALSPENNLLIELSQGIRLAPVELDRTTNTWGPVTVGKDSGSAERIMGFDGLTLVTEGWTPETGLFSAEIRLFGR
jgi:hypothetical protein